uniref:(northern house mosquito) hypothetical protein n=1 Tax=Culex pipiens TaxID=7175 RepID=A0A8D8ILB3_CULPI
MPVDGDTFSAGTTPCGTSSVAEQGAICSGTVDLGLLFGETESHLHVRGHVRVVVARDRYGPTLVRRALTDPSDDAGRRDRRHTGRLCHRGRRRRRGTCPGAHLPTCSIAPNGTQAAVRTLLVA